MRCSACAKRPGCRRVRLLAYFGQDSTPCGNCDNCLHPPQTWDATESARMALSAIFRTGQRFGVVHLIDVLRGKDTERVRRWNHAALAVFGVGADTDEQTWRSVFRQLIALGFVRIEHGAHGALQLDESSRAVLRGERAVEMRSDVRAKASTGRRTRRRSGTAPGAFDPAALDAPGAELLERLKAWRARQSREQSVPAYVVLHDATLIEIAATRPSGADALAGVAGIGARKLERYGDELLEIVRAI